MKYLQMFRYVEKPIHEKNLLDFIQSEEKWTPVSVFPFKIVPWAESIFDYKEISTNKQAQKNLEEFLIKFKEVLEGKSIDLSKEVIDTIGMYIEEGSSKGLAQLEQLYKKDENVREIFFYLAWGKRY